MPVNNSLLLPSDQKSGVMRVNILIGSQSARVLDPSRLGTKSMRRKEGRKNQAVTAIVPHMMRKAELGPQPVLNIEGLQELLDSKMDSQTEDSSTASEPVLLCMIVMEGSLTRQ